MKELSIEQKAKAYDEALERARAKYAMKDQPTHQDLVDIFPELAESKDERIRKAMIKYFTNGKEYLSLTPYSREDYIAWLEKQGEKEEFIKKELECIRGYRDEAIRRLHELEQQGEPKLAGKVEPKFHEGDIIIHKELGGDYIHNPHKIIQVDILDKKYRLEGGLVVHFSEQDDYELVEQKPAEWSEEDESMLNFIKVVLNKHKDDVFFDKFKTTLNDCLTWFRNIKSRVGCEVNCTTTKEWSEEDEKHIHSIISTIECCKAQYKEAIAVIEQYDSDLDWLKSLRPQMQWKAVDKEIYVKEPALAQRKDKSEPNHGYVICYDHTLTPDVYERFIMISDIYNQSLWKPSRKQIIALRWVLNNVPYNNHKEEINGLLDQIKDL